MKFEVKCKIQCRETWTEGPPQIPHVQVIPFPVLTSTCGTGVFLLVLRFFTVTINPPMIPAHISFTCHG